jgi:tetratricopeptide (TPR) repeat protein
MRDRTRISILVVLCCAVGCALPAKVPLPRPTLNGWSPATAALTAEPTVLSPEEKALGHFLKGQIALNQNDYDEALSEYEAAVAEDPSTPMLRLRLATLYVRKGKLDKALEQCRKVVEQDPKNAEARLLLAGLLSSTGDEAGSVEAYERVLEFDPENQEAYLYLGVL